MDLIILNLTTPLSIREKMTDARAIVLGRQMMSRGNKWG